ncbi:MAG TPA: four helix bundle protein, partial [Candidatus Acidoferrales bacterium]|nr:four helix bundle protein [Candidatus Acidoferrales bacterium]
MAEAGKAKHYKQLLVWQKGMALAKLVYDLTARFPADERFGLTSQLRRAAVSVPSNIAEGQARHGTGEFLQFLSHAQGSLAEMETQLLLAIDLGFCKQASVEASFNEIGQLQRMMAALKKSLASPRQPLATSHFNEHSQLQRTYTSNCVVSVHRSCCGGDRRRGDRRGFECVAV